MSAPWRSCDSGGRREGR